MNISPKSFFLSIYCPVWTKKIHSIYTGERFAIGPCGVFKNKLIVIVNKTILKTLFICFDSITGSLLAGKKTLRDRVGQQNTQRSMQV